MKKILAFIIIALWAVSCTTKVQPTQIDVYKPVRHYPAIIMGNNLKLSYSIKNTGSRPFVFNDIIPDCTSITTPEDSPKILPPGDSTFLVFVFNSGRNVGLTTHYIRIYGNVLNTQDSTGVYEPGVINLKFDVPIVRPTPDGSDYEETYFASKPEIEFMVDGTVEEVSGLSYQ